MFSPRVPAKRKRDFVHVLDCSAPHTSLTSTHTHFSKINSALMHPGIRPRAQCIISLKNTGRKESILLKNRLPFLPEPLGGATALPLASVHTVPHSSGRACAVLSSPTSSLSPTEGGTGSLLNTQVQFTHSTLSLRAESWKKCTKSKWVLRTITRGYRLQFATVPPKFNGLMSSQAHGHSAMILAEEISSLLDKKAIQQIPLGQRQTGFYSRYFLVKKKGGSGIRPILDLRALNSYLRRYKFRMLTHSALIRLVRPGDWFTSIDLKDAYFHIPIYPPHRKYLRFLFQGVTYEYTVLPFGLSLSPRVFVKCIEAALAPLRERGIRLATYLDDWLLLARSQEEAIVHTQIVLSHLRDLGFVVNTAKSVLQPSQSIAFLGLTLDSVSYVAHLSPERVRTFKDTLARFTPGSRVSYGLCLRLLGLMASVLLVVKLGRLYMRGFQLWVLELKLDPVRHRMRTVLVSAQCALALRVWKRRGILTEGVSMGTVMTRKVITTDASLTGWGGVFEGRPVNGVWSPRLRCAHINYLELMAVVLALRHFLPFLRGHHVLVRTDNTSTVAHINRQGGLRSRRLLALTRKLLLWSNVRLLSLRATHVPGVQNTGADLLSRGSPLYGEWRLNPSVVDQIWIRFGRAAVDLFASAENAHCPLFFSLHDQRAPLGVDALAHEWPRMLLYAFPPLALISPTLLRVRERRLSLILIAPHWPSMPWLAEVKQLLRGRPWSLPLRRDLLTQANGQIFHPHPERLALRAWPLSG